MSVILQHIGSQWQLIQPFERATSKTLEDLKDGEREIEVCQGFIHIVEWDGEPPGIVKLNNEELTLLKSDPFGFRENNREQYREKCFLWVINQDSLIIAREKIRNVKRTHDPDYICHTNLTCGELAYIAGEILFGEDGYIYLNNFSDRYGGRNTPTELWEATKTVFREMGYEQIIDFFELV